MATDENLEADSQSVKYLSEGKTDDKGKIMFVIMMMCAIPIIFIQTAIQTALPTMLDDLAISPAIGQWIVTGYTLIKGIMVPISAFFMSKFQTKQLFLFVLALFSFGSLGAALGGTFPAVFLGSILQGISAGVIFPLIQTILFASFPLNERGRAFGLMSLFMGIGPLLGPSLGGWVVDAWSWQYMYLFLALISFLGFVISYFKVDIALPLSNPIVDWLSIVFSVFGFGGILYGLSVIGSRGFVYYPGWLAILAGLIFVSLFAYRTLHSNQPILNIRLLANQSFLMSILISMLALMALVGVNNIMPIYIQNILGRTALISGLVSVPGSLIKTILSPVSGRVYDEVGIQKLGPIGSIFMLIGTGALFFLTPNTNLLFIILIYLLIYVGFGLLNIPISTAGLNTLKESEMGHGTAVRQTIRGLGSTFSTALVFSTLSLVSSFFSQGNMGSNMAGVRASLLLTFLFTGIMFMLTLFFKEKE